jgi:hypothetical protein
MTTRISLPALVITIAVSFDPLPDCLFLYLLCLLLFPMSTDMRECMYMYSCSFPYLPLCVYFMDPFFLHIAQRKGSLLQHLFCLRLERKGRKRIATPGNEVHN